MLVVGQSSGGLIRWKLLRLSIIQNFSGHFYRHSCLGARLGVNKYVRLLIKFREVYRKFSTSYLASGYKKCLTFCLTPNYEKWLAYCLAYKNNSTRVKFQYLLIIVQKMFVGTIRSIIHLMYIMGEISPILKSYTATYFKKYWYLIYINIYTHG